MNYCSLKDIRKFDKEEYLDAVYDGEMDEYLSRFEAADQEIIKQALYNEEDTSDDYIDGWLSTEELIDNLINSTTNADEIVDEMSAEDMDDDAPNTSFNTRSTADITRKINDIFKVDEIRLFNRNFQKEFLRRCIYDINTRQEVDARSLNNIIYAWKQELWSKIKDGLQITSISWTGNPTSEELTESINTILALVESTFDSVNLSEDVKESLFFLTNIDSLLKETGCIERDNTLKPFEHSMTMYSFGSGHTKMYHNWTKKEENDIEENSSSLIKFLLETIPCVEDSGEDTHGMYIGKAINNFSGLMIQEFLMKYPDYNLRQGIINGIYSEGLFNFLQGEEARRYAQRYIGRTLLYEEDRILLMNRLLDVLHKELLIGVYGNTPTGAKTAEIYKNQVHGTLRNKRSSTFYNTSIKVLNGLKKHVFTDDGLGIPLTFKKLIFNQMYKTVQNIYLSTSLNNDGEPDITLLHDKQIKSQSSELTNSLVGRIKYFRRNPKAFQSALEKAGIVIDDENHFTIIIPNGPEIPVTISKSEVGAYRFSTEVLDPNGYATEGLMNVLKALMGNYCGLPNIYEFKDGVKVLINDRVQTIHAYSSKSFLNTVLPVIGTIFVGSDTSYGVPTNSDDSNTVNLRHQYALNEDFALLQYVLNGYDNSNVVKSIEGTSLPNYGLRSSIYDYPLFIDKARVDLDENPNSVFIGNPILASKDALRVVNVTINNGVDLNGQTKLVSQMSAEEHAIQGIFINFLKGLKSPDQIAYHYTIVDSDKSRQFYIGFDLESLKINGSTLASLLNGIIDENKRLEAINTLTEYISNWQRARNAAALADILNSYAIVYSDLEWEKTLDGLIAVSQKNINLVNGYLKNTVKSVSQLRKDFRNKGVILWEEYHFTKGLQLNESYIYQWKIHETPESTAKWFDNIKRQVAVDLTKNGESVWYTDFSANVSEDWVNDKRQIIFAKIFDKEGNLVDFGYRAEQYLFNEDGSINENYNVVLNPIIEAYYYSDIICSNSFNDIYYGFVENQDNKSKGADSEKLASRNSSGYKRTVHAGSPGHHLTRGWGRSSSTHVSATIIEDESVVHSTNAIGESTDVEPQDGGAQRTMVEYFIEKWSLGDAAIGPGSSKTIWNDNQQGKSILWKFASFDMSNDVRRASGENSTNSAEDLTRKALEMVDHTEILKHVNFSKYFGDTGEYKGYLYTYNPFTGVYTKIDEVINNRNGSVTIKYHICDEKGNTKPKVFKKDHRLNSLYDIDQILGGAYVMTKEDSGLEYSDIQSEILAKIICDNGLHEDFIAYFLPKSAVKSGRSNMNEYEAWRSGYKYDPTKRFGDLWTFRMSTEHSRLMMNAEHEIDSSITETSQMISSLCQMGYTKEEANFVYTVIGQIVETAKKTYYEDLDADDSARRRKLEKFVIDALESTKGTATGISDSDALAAFCRKNKIRLPLSMPAVLSKLAPAINSELTKEFIRRSYPGVAAVNAPSYNMIETYKFGDLVYDYTSFSGVLYQDIVSKKYAELYTSNIDFLRDSAGDKLIDKNDINEILVHNVWKYINILNPNDFTKINNPYIIEVTSNTEINQGDTIVYRKKGESDFKIERLNSYIESDKWRHLNDLSEYEAYKWTIKPRNLEQPHLQLVVNTNYGSKVQVQQRFTEYDTDGTRAQLYFRDYLVQKKKKKLDEWEYAETKIALIDKVWTEIRESLPTESPYNVDWRDLDPKFVILKMTNYQQNFLKALGNASKNNESLEWQMQEGFKNKILDYTVSDEDFMQMGRIDSSILLPEDAGDLGSVISSMSFLSDFDKQSLLVGLTVEEGMLREAYTNSSNVALVINSFQDIFFKTSDSVRMLKFVRQMQKAYELDGREFNAIEFLKQLSRIKNEFNSNGISSNVVMDQWSEQLRWAIEARNLTNSSNVIISDIKMLPGKVGLSAAYAKEYLLSQHDQVADILKLKEGFFKNKLKGMVSAINAPKSTYDFAKVDKHGNTVLFKIGGKELLNSDLRRTIEEVIDDNINVVKLKGSVLCKSSLLKSGKIDVRRLNYKRDSYTIIRCDSVEEAIAISNSEMFSDRAEIFNLTKDNMYSLYEYMIHEDNQNRIIDHKGNYHFKHRFEKKNDIIKTKTLSSSEVEPIRQNENKFFELLKEHVIASEKDFVNVRARNLYNSFKETLKYIGVRTPSQAMQSFMPLEVAIFVGSGDNLVYIPAAMTWFQGANR